MKTIDPAQNGTKDNYKLLIGSVIPRPIAFVTSMSEAGVVNGAPFSFFNVASSDPPMISVAVQRKDGVMKDTARNVLASESFVVHIVDQDNVSKINETAASLPYDVSELEHAGLTEVPSTKIDVPGIEEAKIRMECRLAHHLELRTDEGAVGTDFFLGQIVQFHVDESVYEAGKIDPETLQAVSRLAGNDYAKIGEMFTIDRPE